MKKNFVNSFPSRRIFASLKQWLCIFIMAAAMLVASACRTDCADSTPPGFVHVAEAVPDAILEVRYYSTYNFIGERIDGYEEPCALLTVEAARALKSVASELIVQGYRLKVFDAYRPACAVKHFVLWGIEDQDIRMKPYFYPDLEKQELFIQGYIASRSSHSRGSTRTVARQKRTMPAFLCPLHG